MPEQDQNTAIPTPLSSGRPGGFKPGDEVTMYGQTVRVVGTRPDGSPIVDVPVGKTSVDLTQGGGTTPIQTQKSKGPIRRGQWLANRLRDLYADPIYTKASPDVQKYYKDKAYDKWVVPYYKHIGLEPMAKDTFVSGGVDPSVHARIESEKYQSRRAKAGEEALKVPSKVLSGISSLLETVTRPLETKYIDTYGSRLHQVFKTSEQYYDKQAQDFEDRIQDKGGHDLGTAIVNVGEEAVFFEALGGAKAFEMLKFANPKTAALATKTAKTAWNGAVAGTLWGATTGAKPSEYSSYAGYGALTDLGLSVGSAGFMKVLGKITSRGVRSQILEQTAQDLAGGKGVVVPKVDEFVKGGSEVNKKAAKAASAKVLNEAAQKVEGGDTNGAFKRLSPKKQKALLVRISMATENAKDLAIDNEIQVEHLQEQEAKIKDVVPVAGKIQQQVDALISKTGLDPAQAKIGATLPHHTTTEESPVQHITARISFLTNQLKARGRSELIMSDIDTLKEALRQEKELYATVKKRSQQSVAHGVGGVSREEIARPGKNYVVGKGGTKISYHGKAFDPGGIESGATHVTVLPDGSIRVNNGILTKEQEAAVRRAISEK